MFESQYLRLRTSLPSNPNLYGLGEHSDPFRLNSTNYIRTLWSSDAYAIPAGSNLYGNHPVYFEHRATGTHGVFFLNSNGMDIKINNTNGKNQYLEYNTLGGVLDFYFVAGPTPVAVSQQYAEIVGLPAMMPYWGFGKQVFLTLASWFTRNPSCRHTLEAATPGHFLETHANKIIGFHNCRYGYQDAFAVAEAIHNYSAAGIPLETMWTDIDYMDLRRVNSYIA